MGSTLKDAIPKKPKGNSNLLSSNKLATVHYDMLCFQLLGSHERKDCLQLRGEMFKHNNGNGKALHMVQ